MTDSARELAAESHSEHFELAPCGLLLTTPDDVIVRVNRTFLEWTGYTAGDILGRPLLSLLPKGSQLFYETRYIPVLRLQGEAREIALEVMRPDSSILPILINATIEQDADGAPSLVRIAVFDSTARQDYERELLAARKLAETSEARVRVLQDASIAFAASVTEAALAEALSESARTALAARAVGVLLLDDDGRLQLAGGKHPLISADAFDVDVVERAALERSAPLFVPDLKAAAAVSSDLPLMLRAVRLEAVSAVLLPGENGPVGVLTCFFGRAREFDDATTGLQAALARQAALALARLRLQRQLLESALHDQLTGLANRRLLGERLSEALKRAKRGQRQISVIFLDLDGFKQINDRLGHSTGDSVLLQVADRLRAGVRDTDVVGRFGGDEFVVVCEDADAEAAMVIAERLRDAVLQPLRGVPKEFALSASSGVAIYDEVTQPGMTGDQLIGVADAAMYRSKQTGKNRVTLAAQSA